MNTPQHTYQIAGVNEACQLLGGKAALARALDVKPATVQQWTIGERPVPPRFCTGIEMLVAGKVSRRQLCEDWQSIWPELQEGKVSK